MQKFLHAADIHLDSPLRGLERYDGAPVDEIRHATRRALTNLVDLALEERVDFLVLSGDLYDGDWRDFKTGRFFLSEMFRLRDAGIPVFLISGNHDAANRMTRQLDLRPAGVRLFDHNRPERVVLDDLGVALHGQSYAKRDIDEDLSEAYPAADGGLFHIGLLHTCGPGQHEGHARYAPCNMAGLRQKEYQYWALGHVHKRAVLGDDPPVVFCGNIQGRHIREEGAKGCILVEIDARRRVTTEFRELDVFRWKCCTVDAAGAASTDELLQRAARSLDEALTEADGRPLAVRLEVAGRCAVHETLAASPQRWEQEFRSLARDVGDGRIWLEKVRWATAQPSNRPASPQAEGPIAELLHTIDDLQGDPARLAALAEELEPLRRQLPAELREGEGDIGLASPDAFREALDQVREMLLRELWAGEVGR